MWDCPGHAFELVMCLLCVHAHDEWRQYPDSIEAATRGHSKGTLPPLHWSLQDHKNPVRLATLAGPEHSVSPPFEWQCNVTYDKTGICLGSSRFASVRAWRCWSRSMSHTMMGQQTTNMHFERTPQEPPPFEYQNQRLSRGTLAIVTPVALPVQAPGGHGHLFRIRPKPTRHLRPTFPRRATTNREARISAGPHVITHLAAEPQ